VGRLLAVKLANFFKELEAERDRLKEENGNDEYNSFVDSKDLDFFISQVLQEGEMKTVEFTYSFDPFLYRTNSKESAGVYVLASEVTERIKYLKKAYRELLRDTAAMMGEDAKRIKALEDALKIIIRNINAGAVNVYWCRDFAEKALEVKP
jgi:hypothetical protein